MRTFLFAAVACSAAAAGYFLTSTSASPAAAEAGAPAPVPQATAPPRLVAHEWGTFTSFSGSNGLPVGFSPNNTDLPSFVYHQVAPFSKSGRLQLNGLISMETPVIYFYTDRETKVDVKVDFPNGWITEWYPFAAGEPGRDLSKLQQKGQSIRWKARLLPGETYEYARAPHDDGNPYYLARATDAVALQVDVPADKENPKPELRGGAVVQRDNMLFYRGVGSFPPPVTVKALGGGRVVVRNAAGGTIGGLALVTVRGGNVGFRALPDVVAGAEGEAVIPEAATQRAELAEYLVKNLTAAGLYEKEARAMVKTWDHAWFGEEGTRLLYLVPRSKTDEVLPLAVEPKPAEVVRVLVGRHDFLTPEQEASADQQLTRLRAAEAEAQAARDALAKLGRFSPEAQRLASRRLDGADGRE